MKFVVVGLARTGTTMLLATLNTIESFNTFSEPLATNKKTKHPQKVLQYFRDKDYQANKELKKRGIIDFLDWIFLTDKHVGFKILYQHMTRFPKTVDYINNNDIYKVHIMRKNPVKRVISGKLNKYHHFGIGTNKMNPNNILKSLKESRNWDKRIENTFGKDRYMKIYYEDLTNDMNAGEMDLTELFEFFGVDINPIIKVPTKKYGPDKLSERISNYEELYKYFESKAPEYLKYIKE